MRTGRDGVSITYRDDYYTVTVQYYSMHEVGRCDNGFSKKEESITQHQTV